MISWFSMNICIIFGNGTGHGDGDEEWKQKSQVLNEILYGYKLKTEHRIWNTSTIYIVPTFYTEISFSTTINFLSFIFHAYVIQLSEMAKRLMILILWFWLKGINCLFAWISPSSFSVQLWHRNCTINLKTGKTTSKRNQKRLHIVQTVVFVSFRFGFDIKLQKCVFNWETSWEFSWELSLESNIEIEILFGCFSDPGDCQSSKCVEWIDTDMCIRLWTFPDIPLKIDMSKLSISFVSSVNSKQWTLQWERSQNLVEVINSKCQLCEQHEIV